MFNAKLALKLAGDSTPTVANFQANNATGGRFSVRHKPGATLVRPLSKAQGWARIPELYAFFHIRYIPRDLHSSLQRRPP